MEFIKVFLLSILAIISMISATQVYAHPCGCGNGAVDQGEVCDGTPGCAADCLSQTVPPATLVCGGSANNGRVCAANEVCGKRTYPEPEPLKCELWDVLCHLNNLFTPSDGSFNDPVERCHPSTAPNVRIIPYTP